MPPRTLWLVVFTRDRPRRPVRRAAGVVELTRPPMDAAMSELARQNGWRGFDGIGEAVEGGSLYLCDGMPSHFGCGAEVTVSRRFARVGVKSTGWLVCYGIDTLDGTGGDDGKGHDLDVVLTFCPNCRAVVEEQERARGCDRV